MPRSHPPSGASTVAALVVIVLGALLLGLVGVSVWVGGGRSDAGSGSSPPAGGAPPSTTGAAPSRASVTVLAAGDIGECGGGAEETGRLVATLPGTIAALGDIAYPDGSPEAFARCFDPAWGPVRDRIRPAMGNHDAQTPAAAGYFAYFGAAAGPAPDGYYSYELGAWHVAVLNSNCGLVGGCGPGSPQLRWLEADLAAAGTRNILAYWHAPRFSTGVHGDSEAMAALWETLVRAGADIVLAGHDHDYQRFAPMDADGAPDPGGVREFVVGTGGAGLRRQVREHPALEVRVGDTWGVLRLELVECGYRWSFIAVDRTVRDQGAQEGTCRD